MSQYVEPVPHLLVHRDQWAAWGRDQRIGFVRRMFPAPVFDDLRRRHPEAFGLAGQAKEGGGK